MKLRRSLLLSLLILALSPACGSDSSAPDCPAECPEGWNCRALSGLCVPPIAVDLAGTNLAPAFDLVTVAETTHVLLFDRLWGRFIHGKAEQGEWRFEWHHLADTQGFPPASTPTLRLVAGSGEILALFETSPGEITLGRLTGTSWTMESLVQQGESLSFLDALHVPDQALQIVIGGAQGELFFATFEDGQISGPDSIELDQELGRAAMPAAAVRFAGRTTLLSALRPLGLASLSRNQDQTWKATMLDAEAAPLALAAIQTGDGLLTAYMDGITGGLKYAANSADKVQVTQVEEGVVPPGAAVPEGLYRLSLAKGPAAEPIYMTFYHATTKSVELLRYDGGDNWEVESDLPLNEPFLPHLVFDTDATPMAAGMRAHPTGWLAPGAFVLLQFP